MRITKVITAGNIYVCAQWRVVWDGNIMPNTLYPSTAWKAGYSDLGSFEAAESHIMLYAASSENTGAHAYAYLPVDMTNCKTLNVYGRATQTGSYYCGVRVWVQPTVPDPNVVWEMGNAGLYTWSSNSAMAWTSLDVSSLSGIHYVCIAKWHWPGYIYIEDMYFDLLQ